MFSVEHASSKGPAVIGEGGVAKQAVEFPQVLASDYTLLSLLLTGTQFSEF